MYEQQSFDQPYYIPSTPPQPEDEGDFLSHYEIKSWEMSPRLYKILAISAFLNIAAVLITAQGSLLTRKGCDSPLVGSVCQVLDTVVVGSILFGTQREYVDAVYDRTELGADDDITFVDVSKETPPLTYPAGYFELANPEQQFAMLESVDDLGGGFTNGNIPGIPPGIPISPPSGGNSIFDTPQHLPKPNPNPIEGELPGMGGSHGGFNPPVVKRRGGLGGRVRPPAANPSASPSPSPDETVAGNNPPAKDPAGDKKVDPTEPITDAEINKRPFVLLGEYINGLIDKKEVQLDAKFVISATGKLDKTGKFDPKSFKYIKAESTDPNMVEVVKESIEALNDSGYLAILKDLSGKNLSIQVGQDGSTVAALVQSEVETDLRARTISSLLNVYIDAKKKAKEGQTDQNDIDDLLLLQNSSVRAEGKKVIIQFNVPQPDVQRMIQRKLAEQRNQPKQPDGTPAKPANTAG